MNLPLSQTDGSVLTPNPKKFPFYSRFTSNVFGKPAYSINAVDEMYDISMVLPFLATERGIVFTLKHLTSYYGTNFRYIPLIDEDLVCSVVVMWKKANEKDSVKEFVDCLKRATSHLRLENICTEQDYHTKG